MNNSNQGDLKSKGGRPPKLEAEKYRRKLITLPPDIAEKLDKIKNASELIASLLENYFWNSEI